MVQENNESENKKIDLFYAGKRISGLREEFGMSRVDLASCVGCSEPTIRYLEDGKLGGSAFFVILWFYKKKLINPAWILLENNSELPKYLLNEFEVSLENRGLVNKLTSRIKVLELVIDNLRKEFSQFTNCFTREIEKFLSVDAAKAAHTQIISERKELTPIEKP